MELAPTNTPAAELLERTFEHGQTMIRTKASPASSFERHVASLHRRLLRPNRTDHSSRFGSLGGIRPFIESAYDTVKDQLSLERHRGRTLTSLISCIARLLALAAATLHNRHTNQPDRNPVPSKPRMESIV